MEDRLYIESASIHSDRCEEFLIHQPVTHSCTALKIDFKNEFNENLVWRKIHDGLQKNCKKILKTFAVFNCVNLPNHANSTNIHIDCILFFGIIFLCFLVKMYHVRNGCEINIILNHSITIKLRLFFMNFQFPFKSIELLLW